MERQDHIPISEARDRFPEISSEVYHHKNRVIVTRRGKEWVAIVPIEDLRALEALEDEMDLEEVRKGRADIKKHGSIPWEKVKRELGL